MNQPQKVDVLPEMDLDDDDEPVGRDIGRCFLCPYRIMSFEDYITLDTYQHAHAECYAAATGAF